ncbi:MAG: hypothetical protein ACRESV_07225, partial [Nevskiales bacterium]
LYMAPCLLGDRARGLVQLPGLNTLAQRLLLSIEDIRAVGADWRIMARPIAEPFRREDPVPSPSGRGRVRV